MWTLWTHLNVWSVAFRCPLKWKEGQTGLLTTSNVHPEDVSRLLSDDANHMLPFHWHILQLAMIINVTVGKLTAKSMMIYNRGFFI